MHEFNCTKINSPRKRYNKRTLRDIYDDETQNIIVDGNDGYQKAKNFMKILMPSHVKKIKKYRDKVPLFIKENIEIKLNDIYDTS